MARYFKLFFLVSGGILAMAVLFVWGNAATAEDTAAKSQGNVVMVDDFEAGSIANLLGNKTNVFVKAPSKIMVSFRKDTKNGKPTNALMVRYDKQNSGGPNDSGGWCGYYTLLKKLNLDPGGDVYFDGSANTSITFWVRGEKGNENFVIGLADEHWDKVGDSIKSQEIIKYLPAGKITTEWQEAVLPLDEFFLDYSKLSSIAIVFESDCFPEGKSEGKIYLDDLVLE